MYRPRALLMLLCAALLAARAGGHGGGRRAGGSGGGSPRALPRCGGSNDPSTDSHDVVNLFKFAKTVCVDQLGDSSRRRDCHFADIPSQPTLTHRTYY